jgi:hypothetical protein
MDASECEDFDPRDYQNLPRLPLLRLVDLAHDLLRGMPKPPHERVADVAERVKSELDELEAAITKWKTIASEATLAEEAALDAFVDGLWTSLHARLDSWAVYEKAELLSLSSTRRGKVDYPRYIAAAQRAADILDRLFGDEGASFTNQTYSQQAKTMAAILKTIEDQRLGEAIDNLVGPDLLAALRDCQGRYEAMVVARTTREQKLGLSLRQLGEHLRWELNLYVIHVLGLADRSQPASIVTVKRWLAPILDARATTRVRPDGGVSGEWSIEAVRKGL